MSINGLIFRNLKKNIKHYSLYVFALVFSVSLYFAFVTLQYAPSLDETKGTIKGAAAIQAASVLLIGIVAVFLLYANNLFIKRRSREIGLFQLIGLTKGKIFQILSAENLLLYFGSILIGIFFGYSVSKLIMMILIKITGVNAIARLTFSPEALVQTLIVFTVLYFLIMAMNYIFIKRHTILTLFRVTSTTEGKVKKLSVWQNIMGILGIGLIIFGYYLSTKLFSGDFTSINELFFAMITILGSVIVGTYLFYKGSVSFIFNLIRKRKDGYMNINDVLSLSSIMFRMKSNSLLLTVITTVSALAIGLLALSYISYYSAEKTAREYVPNHFVLVNQEDTKQFTAALSKKDIQFSKTEINILQVDTDMTDILETNFDLMDYNSNQMPLSVISAQSVKGMNIGHEDVMLTGYSRMLEQIIAFKKSGTITFIGKNNKIQLNYLGLKDETILSTYFTGGGLPVAIVSEETYKQLEQDINEDHQLYSFLYIGIDVDASNIKEANELFLAAGLNDEFPNESRYEVSNHQKQNMGLMMFIVGFLGLTFLVTSGCILYFKQVDESEEEKPTYTILRKLGFTQQDLISGVQIKQLFNFGIPLIIGLSHSYFAVKSGWFFFGTELWTPMMMVMLLYTALYSIFGILSVIYYKQMIKIVL